MSNWIGQTIGGYEIAEEIGRGGVAVVYRAYQSQLERWVAVKILQSAEFASDEFLARFRREAKAIAALRHPNILTIYDYGEERGIAYFVMEYVTGGSLKARLTGEPMEWPDVATLLIPVGKALAYAHSHNIVHRDVKPANILLARPDWPLLADFGLVKLLEDRQRGITRPGTSVGTPAYFSPEQAIGDDVDHRSDVYGLGIVLYEMLTGHVPFESESPFEMMLRRLREPPIPPRRLNPHITPQLEAVLLHALAQDPVARYPTMEALVDDLSRLPGAAGRSTASAHTPTSIKATVRLGADSNLTGPRLVVMGTGATISLPQQEKILLGRAGSQVTPQPDVDLGLHGGAQAGVSRHHARLIRHPEGWLLEDLQSTNGTLLNNVPVRAEQPIHVRSGDIVCCGQLKLMFYEG